MTTSSNVQTPTQAIRITKNQGHMTSPKEENKAPVTDPKEREIYELPYSNLEIIILKNLIEL